VNYVLQQIHNSLTLRQSWPSIESRANYVIVLRYKQWRPNRWIKSWLTTGMDAYFAIPRLCDTKYSNSPALCISVSYSIQIPVVQHTNSANLSTKSPVMYASASRRPIIITGNRQGKMTIKVAWAVDLLYKHTTASDLWKTPMLFTRPRPSTASDLWSTQQARRHVCPTLRRACCEFVVQQIRATNRSNGAWALVEKTNESSLAWIEAFPVGLVQRWADKNW